jgi:undecaprenyl-diphosphatase
MKYIYLNLIALLGFVFTYFAFYSGYFSNINNILNVFPRRDFLVYFFFIMTDIGSLIFISLGFAFLIVLLVVLGRYREAFYSAVACAGGLISQTVIKNTLVVNRPENGLVSSFGYSFPSGHTNMATILFLSFCIYVFSRLVDNKKKKMYFAISIIVILLVGLSRIYLNAHWTSDVLAGWCLGMFWATMPLAIKNLKLKI